jgi:predicted DNA binding CopG/RHH family protein
MKKIKLDPEEQRIEDEAGTWVPISGAKKVQIDAIIESARKAKNINIRISQNDLDRLKERSMHEGLPYQTLVTSVLHKYVTNQLVEEESILKSIRILHRKAA